MIDPEPFMTPTDKKKVASVGLGVSVSHDPGEIGCYLQMFYL